MAPSTTSRRTLLPFFVLSFCLVVPPLPWVGDAEARPPSQPPELAPSAEEEDLVGDVDGTQTAPQKALQDTIWIADWSFDTGSPCSAAGWTHVDNHVLNDVVVYWHMEGGLSGAGGIMGTAAAVGTHGNLCCSVPDGYDNDWYQAIRLLYTGAATLSFDYRVDSEAGFDFLRVESDSGCASFARVDYRLHPLWDALSFRTEEAQASGLVNGSFTNLDLPGYGAGSNCVYIAFFSDGGFSPCDGDQPTTIGEAVVVDNIEITDASGTRTEDFEDGDLDLGTFVNIADSAPFGIWARLFPHISDNDVCTENTTCAWLWTDHKTPTRALDPSLAFGPGGFVVRNWLDDSIVSPWVSLAGTPTAAGTVLQFRRFPGNFFNNSRIVQNWSVRGRRSVAGQTCISRWGHASQWNSLSFFGWQSLRYDMTPNFDPASEAIQIRHRTSDWQLIANPPIFLHNPGPGPYTDRTRIGRLMHSGPSISEGIDSRSQGQDCFPTEIHPGVTPAGQHFRPTTDRFGACALSEGTELAIGRRPAVITGDSINVSVQALRPVPGGNVVTSVVFYGAVVAGPHQGKAVPTTMATAPPPWVVGANGFFSFAADSSRSAGGVARANNYFVDTDDFYFRGGDVLQYFWAATDAAGGFSSVPMGLTAPPVSIAQAEQATGGLFEVNFLPAINWDPAYRAAILADDYGDIAPTPGQLANSTQKNRILYVQNMVTRRRSGQVNRTSFMWSLDRLGYGPTATDPFGHYDVYDHQGMGNTNNQLGGRATIEQCQGYSLIVYDNGNGTPGRPLLPDGIDLDSANIDQATWFRNWLAQAASSEAGSATLWLLGSSTVEERPTNALFVTDMEVTLTAPKQSFLNPEVVGAASFAFVRADGAMAAVDFTGSPYVLSAGHPSSDCALPQSYDGLDASGTAVVTHRYRERSTGTPAGAALVMKANPAGRWNTLVQSHPWFHIQDIGTQPPASPQPAERMLEAILNAVLPSGSGGGSTGAPELGLPSRTTLHPNWPNPFNPVTTLRYDLAHRGRVTLRLYDVAGRQVRTLLEAEVSAGRDKTVLFDGRDAAGRQLPSGVYLAALEADGARSSRKLLLLR